MTAAPPPTPPTMVTIPEAFDGNHPILDPLGNRLHYPGEPQYEAWREEYLRTLSPPPGKSLADLFGADPDFTAGLDSVAYVRAGRARDD